jgi:hypothetical protein
MTVGLLNVIRDYTVSGTIFPEPCQAFILNLFVRLDSNPYSISTSSSGTLTFVKFTTDNPLGVRDLLQTRMLLSSVLAALKRLRPTTARCLWGQHSV